jgi:hypothetical protein
MNSPPAAIPARCTQGMTSTRYILLLLTLTGATIFISCNSKRDRLSISDLEIPDSSTAKENIIVRQGYLENVIGQISAYPSVDCAAVDIGGVETEQYKRFLWLKRFTTEQELIELTKYDNGKVKAYAFWALADRNYPNCKAILEQHLKDTTSFQFSSGCLGNTKFINLFYLSCLSSKLSDNEIALYKKEISKSFDEKK